ncbi:MAG: hypothetical protein K8M05_39370 [Deltaproteobacteria bacterium]|nr:hypothetical protein [Kofleriaceae bacterium]
MSAWACERYGAGATLASSTVAMATEPSKAKCIEHSIGELCIGGDWACAHGDLGALRNVARALADRLDEPLHRALVDLADACAHDPDRATSAWWELKAQVRQRRHA